MDGVLEVSVGLCVCKLVISLLFLPSLAASHSAISFCCCCLLIFTDFLITTFLSFLCIFEHWLTDLTTISDVIALRFLLLLSHIYGLVLLLTTPLIAVEALTRLLWPRWAAAHRTSHMVSDGDGRSVGEVTAGDEEEEEDDSNNGDADRRLSVGVSYLCCLSVWVVVALSVTWRQQEVWTADCLHRSNSLIRCLPNHSSPVSSTLTPCWIMAFLSLLSLILTISSGLEWNPVHTERTHREKCGLKMNEDDDSRWQGLVPAPPVNTDMSVSVAVHCVDPETTDSSCTVHTAASWNSTQVSTLHHGDLGIVFPECLSAGRQQDGTKTVALVRFSTEDPVESRHRSQRGCRRRGFPSLGVNVMIVLVGVLAIFFLPINLSVNIILIRTIDVLVEQCVRALVSFLPNSQHVQCSQ
ncbi:uncharacterized protein [Antennarius striatus]|uniref:uncharacterized protein n=1 Tax=Antennarius striatus TaxID=241820 RepID=UPI0035B0CA0D